MRVVTIGSYVDRATSRVYEVKRRTIPSVHSPLAGNSSLVGGVDDYITACGINLNPKADDESVFEMIEIDGILHRQ